MFFFSNSGSIDEDLSDTKFMTSSTTVALVKHILQKNLSL